MESNYIVDDEQEEKLIQIDAMMIQSTISESSSAAAISHSIPEHSRLSLVTRVSRHVDNFLHLQMRNGLQFKLTNSNIKAQCLTPGNNTSTVSHPQPPVPSGRNDRPVIGFSTGLGPKNRYIDVHFHGAGVTTRAIPDTKFNKLYDRIKSDTHFWN